jgi:hypothetical protein
VKIYVEQELLRCILHLQYGAGSAADIFLSFVLLLGFCLLIGDFHVAWRFSIVKYPNSTQALPSRTFAFEFFTSAYAGGSSVRVGLVGIVGLLNCCVFSDVHNHAQMFYLIVYAQRTIDSPQS